MTHFTEQELRQWSRSGPGPDRDRLVAHLGGCASCAAAYADAVRAASMAPEQATAAGTQDIAEFVRVGYGVPGTRAAALAFPSRRRAWITLASAAALLVAVAVPYALRERAQPPEIALRGSGVQALAPIGSVDAGDAFRWSGVANAASYRLEVGDATGLLFSTTTTRTAERLAPDAAPRLIAGADYWWTVTAMDAAGREIASSGRQAFRIRAR